MARSDERMDKTFDKDICLYTNILQNHVDGSNSTPIYTQQSNVGVQPTPRRGEKRPPASRVPRGASFTIGEDNLLIDAWLNVSQDPIRDTNQKFSQMWDRISDFYHEYKKQDVVDRSSGSLQNRWGVIQKCANKFCAAIAPVESLHLSGVSEQDKIEKAKAMYKATSEHNVSFTMDYCWVLLRYQPKWIRHFPELSSRRRPQDRHQPNVDHGCEDVDNAMEVNIERL